MRKKLIVYSVIFLVLQFIKSILIADYEQDYGKGRMEMLVRSPGVVEYKTIRNSDGYDKYQPIVIKKIQGNSEGTEMPLLLVGTTAQYVQGEHLSLVNGAFFTNTAVIEERNVAVISNQLSMELFGTTKAVGNRLKLNQKVYKVVGVYKKHKRLREYIKDDGYERIYIPITCEAAKEANVEVVMMEGAFLDKMPNEKILADIGLNSNRLIMSDQTKWLKESKSIAELPLIVFECVLSIVGGQLLYHEIKRYRHYSYKHYKVNKRTKQYVISGIWGIALLVYGIGVYWVFKMSLSNMYINPNRLPEENIFDLTFYWKLWCQDWAWDNLFMMSQVAPFRKMLSLLKGSLYGINLVQYILLVKILGQRLNGIKGDKD